MAGLGVRVIKDLPVVMGKLKIGVGGGGGGEMIRIEAHRKSIANFRRETPKRFRDEKTGGLDANRRKHQNRYKIYRKGIFGFQTCTTRREGMSGRGGTVERPIISMGACSMSYILRGEQNGSHRLGGKKNGGGECQPEGDAKVKGSRRDRGQGESSKQTQRIRMIKTKSN